MGDNPRKNISPLEPIFKWIKVSVYAGGLIRMKKQHLQTPEFVLVKYPFIKWASITSFLMSLLLVNYGVTTARGVPTWTWINRLRQEGFATIDSVGLAIIYSGIVLGSLFHIKNTISTIPQLNEFVKAVDNQNEVQVLNEGNLWVIFSLILILYVCMLFLYRN